MDFYFISYAYEGIGVTSDAQMLIITFLSKSPGYRPELWCSNGFYNFTQGLIAGHSGRFN